MSVSFGGSIWTQLAFRAKTISKRLGRSLETWNALDVLLIPLVGASSCAEVPGLGLDKWGRLTIAGDLRERIFGGILKFNVIYP